MMVAVGVIHGRFQVLHNDHLKYLLAGKARCRHLVVGITNPDPTLTARDGTAPERSRPEANPLTYFERYTLVRAALEEAGVPGADFSVVPFPINFPDLYGYYVPPQATYFLTIYDDWGRRKLAFLRERGLQTEVLWERPPTEKGISAGDVRRRMIDELPWDDLVPPSTARHLRRWNVPERLGAIQADQADQPQGAFLPREWVPRAQPKLACCNFQDDIGPFARRHGLDGVEWSFTREKLPQLPEQEAALAAEITRLEPLEVRYHCAFKRTDLGDTDADAAREAMRVFRRVCRLVAGLGGRYVTIHIGLGHESTLPLSWDRTLDSLVHLVRYAQGIGVHLCLENLAWGWTSRPELFEKLIRKAGPRATLDIGHARVSPSVSSQQYALEDFTTPHVESFRGAHIYHEEIGGRHLPPVRLSDISDRLRLLRTLPACDWWVLELRRPADLLQTLGIVREFLSDESSPPASGPR